MRIAIGIHTSSTLKPHDIEELLACYFKRDQFVVCAITDPLNQEVHEKAIVVSSLVRNQHSDATLWVGVAGGDALSPTAHGRPELMHNEIANMGGMMFGQKRQDGRPHLVVLSPDINFAMRDVMASIRERLGAEREYPEKEALPVHSLVNCIRIHAGNYTDDKKMTRQ